MTASPASRRPAAAPVSGGRISSSTCRDAVDVLFGQAYFLRFDPKLWDARAAVRAARHAVRGGRRSAQRGYRVALFDAMLAESEAEWAAALDRHRPRFAVIYEDNFNYLSKMCLLRMREAALDDDRRRRARAAST